MNEFAVQHLFAKVEMINRELAVQDGGGQLNQAVKIWRKSFKAALNKSLFDFEGLSWDMREGDR